MPIQPKVIHINGIDAREQTIDELLEAAKLPDDHYAKLQLQELRDSVAALQKENTQLLAEKAGLTEQLGELSNRLKKAEFQAKMNAGVRKKANSERVKDESESRVAPEEAKSGL